MRHQPVIEIMSLRLYRSVRQVADSGNTVEEESIHNRSGRGEPPELEPELVSIMSKTILSEDP